MRQYKFRAWDSDNNKWIDLDHVGISFVKDIDENNQPTGRWVVIKSHTNNPELYKNCLLSQYTGLLDDHMEEIAEGDIVKAYKKGSGLNGTYTVVWDSKHGRWAYKNGHVLEKYQVGKAGNMHCTVIGNIFERSK